MSMNAIALLRVAPDLVRQALPALEGDDVRRGKNGEPLRIRGLENATLVHLDAPLTEDPQVLAALLVMRVGEVIAAHDEPRGVPIYPESYALSATSWDAAIEELGDGADWLRLPQASGVPDLSSMLGPDAASQLAGFAEQLQGAEGQAMMQQAMQMAQSLAQSGALEGLAQQMGVDPNAPPPTDAQGGLDLGAMMQQAQAMLAQNPDLQAQLESQLGSMLGGEAPPDEEE